MNELKIKQLNEQGQQLLDSALLAVKSATISSIRDEFEDKIPLHLADPEKTINMVFAGQYSAGKSTIIKELTGGDVKVGGGITTQNTHPYPWNGMILVDTPGVHSKIRPDHDAIAYAAIAKADLLLFVMTAEGFNDNLGDHFRKLLFEKGKGNETMLVVNKMVDSQNGNTKAFQDELIKHDINPIIQPQFSPEDLYLTFIDAKSYQEAQLETDPDEKACLLKDANWDMLIDNINRFVRDKGIMGRYTTPLYELEQVLTEIIDIIPKDNDYADRMEHLLSQQRRALVDARRNIRERVHRLAGQVVSKIVFMGNELANIITTDADQDEVNKAIQEKYDAVDLLYKAAVNEASTIIQNEIRDLEMEFDRISSSDFAKRLRDDLNLDSNTIYDGDGNDGIKKAKVVSEWIGRGGNAAAKWAINGSKAKGLDSLFKLGTYSASHGHKAILAIGHFFGYKFQPWQAVKIASKIGKVGKVLGGVGVAAGILLDIWQMKKQAAAEEKVREARIGIMACFKDAADAIRKNLEDGCESWEKENIDTRIEEIDSALEELREMSESGGKDIEVFVPLLTRTRNLIMSVYA